MLYAYCGKYIIAQVSRGTDKINFIDKYMAKNPPKGSGRVGAIKDRDQVYNHKINHWTKRDDNGKFMDQKADNKPFKGVRKINK